MLFSKCGRLEFRVQNLECSKSAGNLIESQLNKCENSLQNLRCQKTSATMRCRIDGILKVSKT